MYIEIDLGGGGSPSSIIHGNELHEPEVHVLLEAGDTEDE